MRKSRGFTLVELLVVIGIIALLISILLPALNKARQQAGKVKCMSNMRSLMLAVHMYTDENANQLPFANWDGGYDLTVTPLRYAYGWLYTNETALRAGYGGDLTPAWGTTPPYDGMKTGVLWPYLRTIAVYHCPLDTETSFWVDSERMTSYIMNGAEWAYGSMLAQSPGLRITQFRNTANCVLIWENMEQAFAGQTLTTLSGWNDGSSSPNQGVLANRHYLGANVAFLDGHVDWWDQSTWNYNAQIPPTAAPPVIAAGPNALWCCPTLARGGAAQ